MTEKLDEGKLSIEAFDAAIAIKETNLGGTR
jgi:hypothetical protein